MFSKWQIRFTLVGAIILLGVMGLFIDGENFFTDILLRLHAKKTVQDRLLEFESKVDQQLKSLFHEKQIDYPPKHVTLLFVKDQKQLSLFAGHNEFNVKHIKTYKVLAASGTSGPKLKENDHQVPEGIYSIESLNPNSKFHLALRVNYPNKFDLEKAKEDEREDLGTDIMIHGSRFSVGCIAIGNEAIEEVFVLAAKTEYTKWKLILAPTDLKKRVRETIGKEPKWIEDLDQQLLHAFLLLP